MVKMTNPGLTSADRDKYLAAVKQQGRLTLKNGHEPVQGTRTEVKKQDIPTSSGGKSSEPAEEIICVDDSDSESAKPEKEDNKSPEMQANVQETQNVEQGQSSEGKGQAVGNQAQGGNREENSESDENHQITVMEESTASSDLTKPLTIETKFPESSASSGPGSESTDTASEVGSCFSSPTSGFNSCQNSPQTEAGTGNYSTTFYQHCVVELFI